MDKKLENALEKIKKVLEKRPEVLAAYLYGSHAKGYAREDSDIDVAVIFMPDFKPDDPRIHSLELEDEVNKFVTDFRVNVIPAEAMSFPLKYEATVFGRLFYSRDEHLRVEKQLDLWAEYEDLADFHKLRAMYWIKAGKEARNGKRVSGK